MTREYARHLGHTDLLRERVDGTAGVQRRRPATVVSHREVNATWGQIITLFLLLSPVSRTFLPLSRRASGLGASTRPGWERPRCGGWWLAALFAEPAAAWTRT